MSSSPDAFANSRRYSSEVSSPQVSSPQPDLDSPFLNQEYLMESVSPPQSWRSPAAMQLESPFLQAFEEEWPSGESDEERFLSEMEEETEEEFETVSFADSAAGFAANFSAHDSANYRTDYFTDGYSVEGYSTGDYSAGDYFTDSPIRQEAEVSGPGLILFRHFLPGPTGTLPLEPSRLNPGYINSQDELILSNLQSQLKSLLDSQYRAGGKIRVALVDLTGPTKLQKPDFAGSRSTVITYGASCSKVAALYAAHQLRFDLIAQAQAHPGLTQRQILKAWTNLGIRDRERERPSLNQIFNLSRDLDNAIPQTLDFSPSFQATLETLASFGQANYNEAAAQVIDRVGFPYIASALWQSGLYHPQRGGLWLGANYGGQSWKRDPIGGQSQGVNALALATFYTLLAQGRLIDPDASQRIKAILAQPKVRPEHKGPFEKILRAKGLLKAGDRIYSKFGLWKQWFHDGALIERTLDNGSTIRYVAVILTESYDPSRRDLVLKKLLLDLDKLIQNNNGAQGSNSATSTQEVWLNQFEDLFSDYQAGEAEQWEEWEEAFEQEEELETEDETDELDRFGQSEAELAGEAFEDTEALEEFRKFEAFENAADLLQEAADPELGEFEAYFSQLYEGELLEQSETSSTVIFPSGESLSIVQGATGKGQEHYDPTTDPSDPDFKQRGVHLPLLPLLDVSGANRAKRLSKNFTAGEFARSGGRQFEKARIDPKLVQCLQNLRDHLGKTITITSGYRPYTFNIDIYKKRGKEPTKSQHTSGRGVDVNIAGMSGLEIAKAAVDACGCDLGLGIGYTFAHIDVRGEFTTWTYIQSKSQKDHEKAIREIRTYRNQKCQGKPGPGPQSQEPGKPSPEKPSPEKPTQEGAKPPAESVKFAQQILNATEGERLAEDGDLGRLTRSALERFRQKYGLGAGSLLNDRTQLALAQRALEEIAQQSIFPQIGMRDARTDQALIAFKTERGLGFTPTLDAATRKALATALTRRSSSSPLSSPSRSTPISSAPIPSAPIPLGSLPKLGLGLTPDPAAYRKFRLTTYHVVDQRQIPTDTVRIPIYDDSGRKLAEGSPRFFANLALEGTALLSDGRLINVTGKKISVNHDDYAEVLAYHRRAYANRDAKQRQAGKPPTSTQYSGIVVKNDRVVQAFAFHLVPQNRIGVGYGSLRNIPLVPFRTLAADIGLKSRQDPTWKGKGGLVPVGTQVYIKEYDGLRLPDGTVHDGWFIVNDTGGGIYGVHFDVFVGTESLRKQLKLPEIGQVWFPGIEQRIPPNYTYGLKL